MLDGKEFVKPIGKNGEVSVDVTPDLKVKVAVQYEQEIDPLGIIEAKVKASPSQTDDKIWEAIKTIRAFLAVKS